MELVNSRTTYLNESITSNLFRHSRINFVYSLTNPYLLQIHKRIRTGFLSNVDYAGEKKERLDEIWNLYLKGKSTVEIRDWTNEKYGTTLRTPRPYYTTLIWETLKKLKIRENTSIIP